MYLLMKLISITIRPTGEDKAVAPPASNYLLCCSLRINCILLIISTTRLSKLHFRNSCVQQQ